MIDEGHLDKYVCGDAALRDEILSIFVEQAGKLLSQFDTMLADEHWRDVAHALKGAARGVGAWALGDLCEEAEMLVGETSGLAERRASLLVSLRHMAKSAVDDAHALMVEAA